MMAKNLDINTTAGSQMIKAALLAAQWSRRAFLSTGRQGTAIMTGSRQFRHFGESILFHR
jgi:hypothetical protein